MGEDARLKECYLERLRYNKSIQDLVSQDYRSCRFCVGFVLC